MQKIIQRIAENFQKIVQKFRNKQKSPKYILFHDFFPCETTAKILGFSFLTNQEISPNKWIELNWIFYQLLLFILLVLELISFAISVKNKLMILMVDNIFCCGLIFVILFKIYIVYYRNRTKIFEVIQKLDENFPHNCSDQRTFKVHTYFRNLKTIEKGYYIMFIVFLTQFCSVPFLHKIYGIVKSIEVKWELIVPVYLPFDEQQPFVYGTIILIEIWIIIFSLICITSTDLLFASLMQVLSMEFGILGQVISEINKIEDDKKAIKELKKLVNIHQELIEVSEKMEDIFSQLQLINAFGSIIVLCTASFLAASGIGGYFVAKYFTFPIAVPIQIFIQCYFTQLLIDSSTSISASVCDIDWYSKNVHLQRFLLQIMIRAQKAQTITAWKFFEMSLENFRWIISTSYSYFTVLKATYE